MGDGARVILDAVPEYVIPAQVSFITSNSQFTPKTVETEDERKKLMFRVNLRIDPQDLKRYYGRVEGGLRGAGIRAHEPRGEMAGRAGSQASSGARDAAPRGSACARHPGAGCHSACRSSCRARGGSCSCASRPGAGSRAGRASGSARGGPSACRRCARSRAGRASGSARAGSCACRPGACARSRARCGGDNVRARCAGVCVRIRSPEHRAAGWSLGLFSRRLRQAFPTARQSVGVSTARG